MSPELVLEVLNFVTGATCVGLMVRESVWTWPVGIANNLVAIALFFRSGIYADMALQLVYIGLSIYGWWNWRRGGEGDSDLTVSRTSRRSAAGLALVTVAMVLGISLVLARTDSKVPLADATTTSLSLTAQYMLTRKKIENWWVWIVANAIYVVMYVSKGLHITACLYLVFAAMCVAGLRTWSRTLRRQPQSAA